MTALILAAGVARRLAPLTDRTAKCLLDVGGVPLLHRMLRALDTAGVREVVLVVGHCADQVAAAARQCPGRLAVCTVENPAYTAGSALSVWAARDHLRNPFLLMDADVLFPREFLRRLLAAPRPSAVLLDRSFRDTGEEVKLYTRGDRVVALGKTVVPAAWDQVGEGVGFFRCGAEAGRILVPLLERVIADSQGRAEYEDAFHLLLERHPVGWADVTGLPWTEIDFPDDLRRAREEVLPRIVALEGA
jgi:choline kinase